MVLKKIALVVAVIGWFFSCSNHYEYEFIDKESTDDYPYIKSFDGLGFVKIYSVPIYDRTEDPNYDGSTETKSSEFSVSVYDRGSSNFINNTNSLYEVVEFGLETIINGKSILAQQGFGDHKYSYWVYNWNEIPFEDGVKGRIKLDFVLSNVSNAQVYDFSGVVPVTAKDLLTWILDVHMGYDWMVAGDYNFERIEGNKYKKGEFIKKYLVGEVGLEDLGDSFKLGIGEGNSELVPNQNNPWEASQRTYKSYDPTYLIYGGRAWY